MRRKVVMLCCMCVCMLWISCVLGPPPSGICKTDEDCIKSLQHCKSGYCVSFDRDCLSGQSRECFSGEASKRDQGVC
jgi:hypothetical protein